MKRFLRWFGIIAAIVVVGLVVSTVLRNSTASARASAQSAQTYQTVPVQRGSLQVVVLASGTVRARQSAVLTWQASGKVGQVNVNAGETVKAETVLAELDATSLSQNLIQAQTDLINAQQALQDLYDNAATAAAEAQSKLAAAQKELDDARTARESLSYKRASQDTIDAAYANLVLAQKEVDDAQSFYDQVKNRPETDQLRAQALSALANAKQKRDRNQANYNWLVSGPDPVEIAQADARVRLAETSLADAQRQYEKLKNGPTPEDLKIAENRVTMAQAAVNQSRIVAPFDGTVTDLSVLPGDIVSPNQVAMRIDDLSTLYVDLQVTEVDINKIQVGQSATVTLDATPSAQFTAHVVDVGQVGTSSNGVVYFNATLKLDQPDPRVRPGMTASASVVVSTQEGVLLVPNRAVRTENNKHLVFVPGQSGGVRAVTVQIGDSDENNTVILKGLQEGELVITNPPSATPSTPSNTGFRGIFGGGTRGNSSPQPSSGGNQP
ncbi:MAG TPA: efflux RND transporter periplasmic adaptor subunit [Anaerolinea thermolimosa]|uniref:Efflux RND transporter periplasmic adaptor subunit n=1 Tax=Anaerolinea thermolimosa TaxID=229919 RepID=A0A3D1JFR6_9CHLR|nr:efflux RND transporter periplasmic adaptor subunit [Anaerolinea thermolimosa]GAP08420.1 RND family efflux transporter, MFP subunit [Anaerolinea thermolimosa]HCE17362.1 efflux RND transporter periplasmic adaptor subunit [Anaerolinea thermolimosa]